MIKNLLEDIEYIEPRTDLPIPDGTCTNCNLDLLEIALQEMIPGVENILDENKL